MSETIDISKLDKAEVLAALYNSAKPQGLGFLQYEPSPMSTEEAGRLLKEVTCFDYLKGRVMKVNLSGEELNPRGYDRDNGEGAAYRAIKHLIEGEAA